MKTFPTITHLFLDIGGVILSNGWDQHARKRAAAHFKLKFTEIEPRHRLIFEIYEKGNLSLEEYLNRVVFYQKRPFTKAQFRHFMLMQSKPFPEMIELMIQIKAQYGLKIVVVSNEARELNEYRIQKFKLDSFVDFFISSSFVHLRKPEKEIFQIALDTSRAQASRVVYIENTLMFVQIAQDLGMQTILHTNYKSTREKLISFGLKIE